MQTIDNDFKNTQVCFVTSDSSIFKCRDVTQPQTSSLSDPRNCAVSVFKVILLITVQHASGNRKSTTIDSRSCKNRHFLKWTSPSLLGSNVIRKCSPNLLMHQNCTIFSFTLSLRCRSLTFINDLVEISTSRRCAF